MAVTPMVPALAPPSISTARLSMRPLAEGDRRRFIDVHARSWSQHLAPWSPKAGTDPPDFEAMFEQQLERAQHGLSHGNAVRLVAFDPHGELVGGFNLNNIVRGVFQNADAGWWVSVDHLRRGYALECVTALLDLAFEARDAGLGLHRVQCGIITSNVASLGVATRAGFRREGVAQRYLEIDGRWQDHVIFAITLEERAR